MILGFSTQWGNDMPPHMAGMPTYFPEKTLTSLVAHYPDFDWETYADQIDLTEQPYDCTPGYHHPKHHTIREDKYDRWKVGMDIHFYINVRKTNMFQFAPVLKVVSIQKIEIIHSSEKWRMPWVFVDGAILDANEIRTLAFNDGFESTKDFFEWFHQDFKGKIIHWTTLKY